MTGRQRRREVHAARDGDVEEHRLDVDPRHRARHPERVAGDDARAGPVDGALRDETGRDVLVARLDQLARARQVHPELEAPHEAALLLRHLRVHDAVTRGHPLRAACDEAAAIAERETDEVNRNVGLAFARTAARIDTNPSIQQAYADTRYGPLEMVPVATDVNSTDLVVYLSSMLDHAVTSIDAVDLALRAARRLARRRAGRDLAARVHLAARKQRCARSGAASYEGLAASEAKPEQGALLYAQRADTENVFDELKNQWGFRGYCSGRAVVTELAARLVLLTYNLWSLFTRLMVLNPGHHTEAIKSRRDFLFLAAQVVESGRQRTVKLAVKAEWWKTLKVCYQRLRTWLVATAPQLEEQGQWLRLLPRQQPEDPLEWLTQPAPAPTG